MEKKLVPIEKNEFLIGLEEIFKKYGVRKAYTFDKNFKGHNESYFDVVIFREYEDSLNRELADYLLKGFSMDDEMFPGPLLVPEFNEPTTTTTKLYEDGTFYAYER